MSLTSDKNIINAGKFTYTVNSLSNENYKLPEKTTSPEYTITPKEIVINWGNNDFTYNGAYQNWGVTATYTDARGNKIDLTAFCSEFFTGYKVDGNTFSADFKQYDSNYKLSTNKTKIFDMKKLAITAAAENNTMIYGDDAPELNWIYANGSAEFAGIDWRWLELTTTANNLSAAGGDYTITITEDDYDNYIVTTVPAVMTVEKRKITVTVNSTTSVYSNELASLSASVTDGSVVNNDENIYQLATAATRSSSAGKYDIIGSVVNANYDITFSNEDNAYTIMVKTLTDDMVDEVVGAERNTNAY